MGAAGPAQRRAAGPLLPPAPPSAGEPPTGSSALSSCLLIFQRRADQAGAGSRGKEGAVTEWAAEPRGVAGGERRPGPGPLVPFPSEAPWPPSLGVSVERWPWPCGRHGLKQFLSLGAVDMQGHVLLWGGGRPAHCRVLSSSPGLHSPGASSTPTNHQTRCTNQKCLWTLRHAAQGGDRRIWRRELLVGRAQLHREEQSLVKAAQSPLPAGSQPVLSSQSLLTVPSRETHPPSPPVLTGGVGRRREPRCHRGSRPVDVRVCSHVREETGCRVLWPDTLVCNLCVSWRCGCLGARECRLVCVRRAWVYPGQAGDRGFALRRKKMRV